MSTYAPRIVSAGDRGITYRVPADRQEEARSAAVDYCKLRNGSAQLQSVTPATNNRSILSFACV